MPYRRGWQMITCGPVFVWPASCGFIFLKVALEKKKSDRDQKCIWLQNLNIYFGLLLKKLAYPCLTYSFPGGYKNRIIKHFRLLKVDAMYAIMIA